MSGYPAHGGALEHFGEHVQAGALAVAPRFTRRVNLLLETRPGRLPRESVSPGGVTRTWVIAIGVPPLLAFGCLMLAIATTTAWPIILAVVTGPILTAAVIGRLAITSDLNAPAVSTTRSDADTAAPAPLISEPQREAA